MPPSSAHGCGCPSSNAARTAGTCCSPTALMPLVLLPSRYRELAQEERVGLPPGHTWRSKLPAVVTRRPTRRAFAPVTALHSQFLTMVIDELTRRGEMRP